MAGDGLPFAGRRLSSLAVADTGCSSVFDTALAASASLPYPPPNAHTGFRRIESTLRFVPPGPGGAGAEKMASAASAPVFERVAGIRTIAESGRFKAWFLDQFGVLHDGKKPYPGAILALEKLAVNGAKMVIISNSSRRSSVTMDKLKSLGFDTSCFLATITSGELTHQHLLKRNDPWFAALGRKCIHITWGNRGAISLEGLGLEVVDNVDDAEFILAHGTEALGSPSGDPLPKSLEELEQVLMLGLERQLPMVVANPDYVTVEARDLRVMPAKYENLGGEVKWMGKPDKVIYNSAMSLAGVDAYECIMVGDSLYHDVKGANASGIASAFITGGIHAAELGLSESGETTGEDAINTLCSKHGSYPSYVLPSFTW
ncbi:hypothetical protein PVAP13_6KG392200 [Panicum virgatum]|uniref:Uncharacterized protein n=1 Tax=Panicum virgatum TaxID=38727 RepID=A0A8T0RK12_PANVG|nr:hypothetical protein PVAP13_6KG392200 [Panicum virgatum]